MTLIGHTMMCEQAGPKPLTQRVANHAAVIRWPVHPGA